MLYSSWKNVNTLTNNSFSYEEKYHELEEKVSHIESLFPTLCRRSRYC